MSLAKDTFSQITHLTNSLIETSLCDDQNSPITRPSTSNWITCQIAIPTNDVSIALKNLEYKDMYNAMRDKRNYNFKLIDGALVIMQYEFADDELIRHTLAFYPNPDLLSFQENEELYLEDEIYADIIDNRILIVPLRFDYDNRDNVYKEIDHPKSHFTLGQFERCRIPVSRPLMPCQFIHFVLRNFYNTAYLKYKDKIYNNAAKFDKSISEKEEKIAHICI